MKKIKSLALAFMFLAISVFGLFGCGAGKTLRVINFRIEDQDYYDWMISEFTKETGIKVTYEAVGTEAYANLLRSRIAAKAVDVIGCQSANLGDTQLYDEFIDLSDLKYHDGTNLWDNVSQEAIDQTLVQDTLKIAPLNLVADSIVFYNKDIVNEQFLGVTFANGEYPTTWQELNLLINRLTALKNTQAEYTAGKKINNVICYGGLEGWPSGMVSGAVMASTVLSVDPDFLLQMALNPANNNFSSSSFKQFFQRLKTVSNWIDSTSAGVSYTRAPGNFAQGGYPLMIDGAWSYSRIKLVNPDINLGFFPLPCNDSADKNDYISVKSGAGFAISKNSKKQDQGRQFIEFMYREDVYQRYIDYVGLLPAIEGVEATDGDVTAMHSFNHVLSIANRWIPGLGAGEEDFKSITTDFITRRSGTTPESAENFFNSQLNNTKEIWQTKKSLDFWFSRFYPDYSSEDAVWFNA